MKHEKAITVLQLELHRLGGIVFARYIIQQNSEQKKSMEAMEFLGAMMGGKIPDKDKDYLLPYLEPMWEINTAIKILSEQK